MTNRQWLLRAMIVHLGLDPNSDDPYRVGEQMTDAFIKRLEEDSKLCLQSILAAYMSNIEKQLYKFKINIEVLDEHLVFGVDSINPGGEDWLQLESHLS